MKKESPQLNNLNYHFDMKLHKTFTGYRFIIKEAPEWIGYQYTAIKDRLDGYKGATVLIDAKKYNKRDLIRIGKQLIKKLNQTN